MDEHPVIPNVEELVTTPLESILVVDDDPLVLQVVATILENAHFVVLQAHSGIDAIRVANELTGPIDLLLCDVQMPGMSGPDLGAILKRSRPTIRIMFMSGYTGGDMLVLNYGWAFIQKPFVPLKLVEMVSSVLHTPNKSQGPRGYDTRLEGKASE